MLKVGLSSCFMYPDVKRKVFGPKSLTYVENDMVNFFSNKDLMPILIPDLSDEKLGKYLDNVSGLVLQGGSDVSPLSYGEEGIKDNKWPGDKHRDDYELRLIKLALDRNLPILGICRGFQILNTYFKGTLYQDLNTQTDTKVKHRDAIEYDSVNHSVDLKDDALLKKVYKKEKIQINSVHHQGVKELGKNLVWEATSTDDGLCEAFRYDDMEKHWIWGVQWHPEFTFNLKDQLDSSEPILNEFIKQLKN